MTVQVQDRREARRAALREEVLQAAWTLARQQGVAALSLRDLAAAVGMRAPSLYGYFASKDAIYDAMFAQGYRELDAALEPATQEAGSRRFRLQEVVHAFLDFCRDDLARYQLLFTRVVPGWAPGPEAYAVSEASYARMATWLEEFGIRGADLDLWTSLTAGLAAQQAANDPHGLRYARLVDDAVDMLLLHLDTRKRP